MNLDDLEIAMQSLIYKLQFYRKKFIRAFELLLELLSSIIFPVILIRQVKNSKVPESNSLDYITVHFSRASVLVLSENLLVLELSAQKKSLHNRLVAFQSFRKPSGGKDVIFN